MRVIKFKLSTLAIFFSALSFFIPVIFSAWMMDSGLAHECWGLWRLVIGLAPFVVLRNLTYKYRCLTGLVFEKFFIYFILIIFLFLYCVFFTFYNGKVTVPEPDHLVVGSLVSLLVTLLFGEWLRY